MREAQRRTQEALAAWDRGEFHATAWDSTMASYETGVQRPSMLNDDAIEAYDTADAVVYLDDILDDDNEDNIVMQLIEEFTADEDAHAHDALVRVCGTDVADEVMAVPLVESDIEGWV